MTNSYPVMLQVPIHLSEEELGWLLSKRDDKHPDLPSIIGELITCSRGFELAGQQPLQPSISLPSNMFTDPMASGLPTLDLAADASSVTPAASARLP